MGGCMVRRWRTGRNVLWFEVVNMFGEWNKGHLFRALLCLGTLTPLLMINLLIDSIKMICTKNDPQADECMYRAKRGKWPSILKPT